MKPTARGLLAESDAAARARTSELAEAAALAVGILGLGFGVWGL